MNHLTRALIIALLALLASCSQGIEDRIVGKWVEIGESPNSIEFFSNGKLLITGSSSVSGTWKPVGAESIEMNIVVSGVKLSEIMTISFIDDRIVATNSKGKSSESIRVY
jgi:hypothetical protein